MMHPLLKLLSLTILLLLAHGEGGHASPARTPDNGGASMDLSKRQMTTGRYCDPATTLCYLEHTRGATVPVFRVAIPDSAGPNAAFDTLLQIVAPVSHGWVGFAWGGGMTRNPLTVVWPNGEGATVSSRWSTGRTLPSMYPSATYRTVSSSRNSTHWTVETVCAGCSRWANGALNTGAGVHTFAWALSRTPVAQPGNSASSFAIHNNVGFFSAPLEQARVPRAVFDAHVQDAR